MAFRISFSYSEHMEKVAKLGIKCVLHGSFRKHFDLIQQTRQVFTDAGIEVIAPKLSDIAGEKDGFAYLEGEENADPRLIELLYLHNLKDLGQNGFSYFVNPEGYIGKSVSYELGIAQLSNIRCFFMENPNDHPAYVHKNSVWKPEKLAEYILDKGVPPDPLIKRNEKALHKLWEDLMVPGSIVAAGAMIQYEPRKTTDKKEILLVKTHKWGDRYSMVGGKVRRNELFKDALLREVKEETGLSGKVDRHVCTFDQIKNSGYYRSGIQHIFIDNVVKVDSRRVTLNEEAQDYIWITAEEALASLHIEPNARHTIELYINLMPQR
ncbi:MAG: hypothetical protein COV34_01700 [Candidatus Zambryskibacteria bacterium CG10_big_fil_rev_8_21_14_0_10_42_12]|uniref:Nudix hydrolase domain-containing protein n=1 Tax=Candidatus Zambryskibacteria bacterium CG10_big_fil_rev_8_21_14_0_10_42_12 TaxID=1975115 RepID=A0A2H0QVK7_9BACT|nr:MAG: hypothetical protein COV34_01700 [Candidatus Zambryskibacteria bacterium CG10_big_fil_rev_8_21_14_0_10_42_12]